MFSRRNSAANSFPSNDARCSHVSPAALVAVWIWAPDVKNRSAISRRRLVSAIQSGESPAAFCASTLISGCWHSSVASAMSPSDAAMCSAVLPSLYASSLGTGLCGKKS